MSRLYLIFVVFVSLNSSCYTTSQHAQNNKLPANDANIVTVDANKPKFIVRTIKLEGWTVPLPAEKELVGTSESKQAADTVTQKTYKFQKAPEVRLDIFSQNTDGSLNMGFEIVQTKEITSYSVKGVVYGYSTGGFVIQSNDGGIIGCGCMATKIYFSDEDGDGKYETLSIGDDVKFEVPKWLKTTPATTQASPKPAN